MRLLSLLIISTTCFAAEVKPEAVPPKPEPPKTQTTLQDLQVLVACARRALPTLSADELTVASAAIKHAEDDLHAAQEAATKAEAKKP